MLTYRYPAAESPVETKASAVCLISSSVTAQPKAFQLLNPMGGVAARGRVATGVAGAAAAGTATPMAAAISMDQLTARTVKSWVLRITHGSLGRLWTFLEVGAG